MRSPGSPSVGRTALRTRDIDAAEEALSRCYLPLRLRSIRPVAPLDTTLTTLALGRATFGVVRFDREIRILTGEVRNFHVDIPLAGRSVSRAGSAQPHVATPGSAQLFMPGERADLHWSANTQELCVMIEKSAVEGHLAALLSDDLGKPLTFQASMDLRAPESGTWNHVLTLIDHELRQSTGLLDHALMRQTLERLLIESLLVAHPHNYSSQLQRLPERYGRGAIGTAIELLETYPDRSWTAGELAAEVGLSVRGLHAGFRSKTDLGPMTYLRQVRLARVYEDLLRADPTTATVTDVARRWGFSHLGRFSAAYAKRYGQLPSETLRGVGVVLAPRGRGAVPSARK